ncbi:hypothetical protein HGRIS_003749 [Hohenbuehelia grisea]|uniref:NADP-dependent oxidoreductase domain-containing protein n=1 Tax=Hohenbuehelia grisea TaxID=104357 RepID=A0ABR3JGZ8_9AGAR
MSSSLSLPPRKIGDTPVSAIGFGAMTIAITYIPGAAVASDEERFKVLDEAYASGCTFWDSADIYGDSEELIGKWFKRTGKRSEIFLATKFGIGSPSGKPIDGDPEYVKAAFEKSLKRLGVDSVDLYYLHRPDPTVPIERTVEAMASLVKAGKVKYLGISECSAATLHRANAVHPISALQIEYSPFTLDIEHEQFGLLKAARELGITVVAYSPLGRGLLTGQIRTHSDLDPKDWRYNVPRFSAENFPNIIKLKEGLEKIGERHGATSGQVALAWLLAQGNDIIPIPGTKTVKYLKENLASADVKLTPADIREVRDLAELVEKGITGARYPPGMSDYLFVDTPKL